MSSNVALKHPEEKSEEFLKWDEQRLSLGVSAMDAEHKKLVSLMNQLHNLAKTGAPRGRAEMVLEELGSYTVKHFADEERHMQNIKYPGFATHQQIHKALLEKFTGHVQAFKASKDNAPSNEFFTFLKMWLQAHIAGVDRKYADHGK